MELEKNNRWNIVLSLFCLILGYCFVQLTFFAIQDNHSAAIEGLRLENGLGLCLFTFAFFFLIYGYAKKIGKRASKESNFWGIMLLLQGLGFLLLERPSTSFLMLMGLFFTAVYWVIVRFGALEAGKTSDWMVKDCMEGFVSGPFKNIFQIFLAFRCEEKDKHTVKTLLQILIGILIAIPVLCIAYSLLCQIDLGFADILSLDSIFSWNSYYAKEKIIIFILGIPVAGYIFGLIFYSTKRQQIQPMPDEVQEITGRIPFLPMATISTVMILVLFLYGFFFVVQGTYLFSAFTGRLPEQYTYAEYARRGFFELCVICILNLMLLFALHYICKDAKVRLLRIFSIAIYVFNLLFLIIAFRKMVLYITTYGLTQKRIVTCWFMVFLASVIVTGILRQFKRFSMLRYVVIAGVILFTAFSLCNMDGWIAKNNIWLYEHGKIEEPDYDTLLQCGPAALPAIRKLKTEDPGVIFEIKQVEADILEDYSDVEWYGVTIQHELVK